MKNNNISIMHRVVAILAACVLLAGCSTTRRLAPGETRYTGVGKFDVHTAGGEKSTDSAP